jgi:hypothetical protein
MTILDSRKRWPARTALMVDRRERERRVLLQQVTVERRWRQRRVEPATFYPAGIGHSLTPMVGSAWTRAPSTAVQRAAWEALRKRDE